ncbi:MAG: HAD family phosphatase [Planctomycetota bacterium]|nr:HAD family phosphatase [Planctomycetota bacterium]
MNRAVIFDFDGLLADTEVVHFRTFSGVLAEEGITVTAEENGSRFMGIDDRNCFQIAFRESGRGDLTRHRADDLVQRKSRLFRNALGEIELFPGAEELVREARRRGPCTIASCGRRQEIEAILHRHGLLDEFPFFVAADEIERPKPDPDCFLRALDLFRHHVSPELRARDCVVFEDSFRGVEAAKRAGMRCVAVTHSFPRERLEQADVVIDSLGEWSWPS